MFPEFHAGDIRSSQYIARKYSRSTHYFRDLILAILTHPSVSTWPELVLGI